MSNFLFCSLLFNNELYFLLATSSLLCNPITLKKKKQEVTKDQFPLITTQVPYVMALQKKICIKNRIMFPTSHSVASVLPDYLKEEEEISSQRPIPPYLNSGALGYGT